MKKKHFFGFLLAPLIILTLIIAMIFYYQQQKKQHMDYQYKQESKQAGIVWQSCLLDEFAHWFDKKIENKNLQCATLKTPLEPFDKNNKKFITLALTRLPAKNPDKPSLLYIQGGPGSHGLSVPLDLAENSPKLHDEYNLIGYAPRGVEPSFPSIICHYDIEKTGKEIAEGCFDYTPKEFLDRISTQYAVEDVEFIRKSLQIDKLNVLGVSYGTKVLNYYAQKYGANLRAGMLDGVVDVTLNPIDDAIAMSKGFQNSFERFVDACLNGEFTDECLFNEHEDKNKQFHKILKEIGDKKLKDSHDNEINGDTIISVFMDSLYAKELWDYMHNALALLYYDNDTEVYNELVDFSEGNDNEESGLIAINCADYAQKNRHDKQAYLDDMKKVDDVALFDNYRDYQEEDYLDTCYYWQADGADDFAMPTTPEGTPPLLFFSFTHDPATPYKQAIKMANAFGSSLITREGDGHGAVFSGSACIDEVALAYLINPQQPILAKNCPAVIE